MDNTLLLIIIGTILVVIAIAAVGRWYAHFEIAEKAAARKAAAKIAKASAADAFSDPQLKALIACPACGTRGEFDVVGKDCRCHNCAHTWHAG